MILLQILLLKTLFCCVYTDMARIKDKRAALPFNTYCYVADLDHQ